MAEPKQRIRRKDHEPQLHAEGMATSDTLAAALVALRTQAGLTQTQLARRAGWNCQFVSRLEGCKGCLPDLTSIVRYAKACGVDIGLVFVTPDTQRLPVIAALTLQSASHLRLFESLVGQAVTPPPQSGPAAGP